MEKRLKVTEEIYEGNKCLMFEIFGQVGLMQNLLFRIKGVMWNKQKRCLYMIRRKNDIGEIFNHLRGTTYFFDYSAVKKNKSKSKQLKAKFQETNKT